MEIIEVNNKKYYIAKQNNKITIIKMADFKNKVHMHKVLTILDKLDIKYSFIEMLNNVNGFKHLQIEWSKALRKEGLEDDVIIDHKQIEGIATCAPAHIALPVTKFDP